MRVQHLISVSGGKDSTAVMCLAVERFQSRDPGNLPPRFLHCDVGSNEHQATVDHIGYLDAWIYRELGARIEILRADFTEQLAYRRQQLPEEWGREKVLIRHSAECRDFTSAMRSTDRRRHRVSCDCERKVMPAMSDEQISRAIELLHPTGDPFVDLTMLKGRFPGVMSRFCTEELKLEPMNVLKRPLWAEGVGTVEWIGERADESPARALKPMLQRIRHPGGISQILYRPIHQWQAEETFEIAARHGLDPNPLYLQGARRVGCWPCIMCGKDEISNIANRTPEHIDRLREWEKLVSQVSRRGSATFFATSDLPGAASSIADGNIDRVVEWARTSRGGRQLDMLRMSEMHQADVEGRMCDSAYGLCE